MKCLKYYDVVCVRRCRVPINMLKLNCHNYLVCHNFEFSVLQNNIILRITYCPDKAPLLSSYLSNSCSMTIWHGVITSVPFLISNFALVCSRSYVPTSIEVIGVFDRMSPAVTAICSSLIRYN